MDPPVQCVPIIVLYCLAGSLFPGNEADSPMCLNLASIPGFTCALVLRPQVHKFTSLFVDFLIGLSMSVQVKPGNEANIYTGGWCKCHVGYNVHTAVCVDLALESNLICGHLNQKLCVVLLGQTNLICCCSDSPVVIWETGKNLIFRVKGHTRPLPVM